MVEKKVVEEVGGVEKKEEIKPYPITPLYDQVFVKKDGATKTKSGLHLTQSVKGRAVTGRVVAVGPGLLSPFTGNYLEMQTKVGDLVYVKEFSGYIITYGGMDVHIYKEAEITGIMNEQIY